MANFIKWIEEAKKKGTKETSPTTATSSPLRGANQDQSGYNVKGNVADYTISDGVVPDNWEENPETKRLSVVKRMIKGDERYGAKHMPHVKIKEASMNTAVVGANRMQPVNQADNTPRKGSSSVSKRIITGLQSSANRRVSALDQAAQKQKDDATKQREQEIEKRKKEAEARQKIAQKQAQQSQAKVKTDVNQR